MTKQRIFDKVATHLITQNMEAKDGVVCRYLAKNGNKCAVGCLISKRYYKNEMEGRSIYGWNKDEFKLPKYFATHYILLQHLQTIHDCYPVEEWKTALINFAKTNNLKVPAILES
jgi:hypothetical protein